MWKKYCMFDLHFEQKKLEIKAEVFGGCYERKYE